MSKYTYKVKGLHCKSCVLIIEERLEQEKGVKSVDIDFKKEEIVIESREVIGVGYLNKIFEKNSYKFLETGDNNTIVITGESLWWFWALLIIGAFLLLSKLGLASFLNINSNSSLITIFVFGLIAGLSSCGALLSGIILAAPENTKKIVIGRIVSYSILGGILGIIGQRFVISSTFTSILMILVSVVMAIIALQMLEFKFARQINLFLPKNLTKKITKSQIPFVVGLLTVFLPCGFTLLTEGVAILSGSFLRGLLIMLVFVLGTSIPLFLIGLSSEKLGKNQKLIGVIILFFVLYNLNFQFGILNSSKSLLNKNETSNSSIKDTQAPLENARLVELTYSASADIFPSSFTFKKGEAIRMELTVNDNGSGCMSTVMIPGLYNRAQTLVKGKKLVMEFVADKVGKYQITCAMGVPRGEINVTE
ncbi:MAG: sulfite exporter TauE/SafE family protein [Candidatus Shapirobacteria bacterium]